MVQQLPSAANLKGRSSKPKGPRAGLGFWGEVSEPLPPVRGPGSAVNPLSGRGGEGEASAVKSFDAFCGLR